MKWARAAVLQSINYMTDINQLIERFFARTQKFPGFLADNEARFLGVMAACAPPAGCVVEIGSFKGKSTVMLASIAAEFGQPPVVAIDPHGGLSYLGQEQENFLDP